LAEKQKSLFNLICEWPPVPDTVPVLNTRVAKLWDLPMITLCTAIDPA